MEFIKNVMEVEVIGTRGVIYYKIKAQYDKKLKDGEYEYVKLEEVVIDEFEYTWKEIDEAGGIGKINEEIKEYYKIEEN
jgi:hypothetical protein